jgi:hypothetical protein
MTCVKWDSVVSYVRVVAVTEHLLSDQQPECDHPNIVFLIGGQGHYPIMCFADRVSKEGMNLPRFPGNDPSSKISDLILAHTLLRG